VGKEGNVLASGGFIIQLLPNIEEEVIAKVEEALKNISSVTELLRKGYLPEDILNHILGEMGLNILERVDLKYECDCSQERFETAIIALGKEEIKKLIAEGQSVEAVCHFCGKKYLIEESRLKELLRIAEE
jgi:molecular chaperone Hsp33